VQACHWILGVGVGRSHLVEDVVEDVVDERVFARKPLAA